MSALEVLRAHAHDSLERARRSALQRFVYARIAEVAERPSVNRGHERIARPRVLLLIDRRHAKPRGS
jgi:hypothetical protein